MGWGFSDPEKGEEARRDERRRLLAIAVRVAVKFAVKGEGEVGGGGEEGHGKDGAAARMCGWYGTILLSGCLQVAMGLAWAWCSQLKGACLAFCMEGAGGALPERRDQ